MQQAPEIESPDQLLDTAAGAACPLLNCLEFLTKYYGKPFSAKALGTGLPLRDGRLTLELFPRAALRGGLSAKLVKKQLREVSDLLFPCVLLLDKGQACVVISVDIAKGVATVAWPELVDGYDEVPLEELEARSSGYLFYIRRRYRFDARAPKSLKTRHDHWFWSTLKQSTPIYRDALVAAFFINLFAVASPLFVMNVYDRVVPNAALDTLWVLAIGMGIVVLFDFILKQLRSYLIDLAAKKSDVMLSSRLFEKLLSLKMEARPASVGAFVRNIQEFDSIRDFITSATMTALLDIPFSVLFLLVIASVAGPLALVPLAAIAVMFLYSFVIQRKMRREVESGSRYASQKNAHLVESLAGIESLKLASAESQFQRQWEEMVGSIATWNLALRRYATSVGSVTGFVQQLSNVAVVVGGVYLITAGEISMGALIAAVMLTGRALVPFSQVALLATRYNQAKSAFAHLDEIMKLPEESAERYLHRPYIDGRVEFDGVSFAYPNAERKVFDNLSFTIEPGEKVGIIGRIGAGKSTIEKLLLGLYTPQEGAIRIDAINIDQISPADLRQKIGCLPQDINLFFGSIRDNITLGVPHVEDERILQAARMAGVTEFTDSDPEGLDRQVGERGLYLSGGQRQAVALARTLLFNPPVLVLDEPTSHMDNFSEHQIKRHLSRIAQEKTFVLITHKMSMLDLCDRLIVIDKGKRVADGPRAQVLEALKNGKVRSP